ncbi:MAG: PLP-dependent aminotransferase family protein [Verrucomicrobiota bacterium]
MHAEANDQETFLYEEVAGGVETMMKNGALRPGDRVPSVRRLSASRGVSVSTVLQAYTLLENRGLIEARPQSGYFVRAQPRVLPPECTITIPPAAPAAVGVSDLVAKLVEAARTKDIVPLGAACPSGDLFPNAKLGRVLSAVARRSAASNNQYNILRGSDTLKRQITQRAFEYGCVFPLEDLVVTSGCAEALNLCLRAVASTGDTVAVESPTYYGMLQVMESLKIKAVEIPTDPRNGMSLEALEMALEKHHVKACFVMANYNNPLGSFMPEERKQALAKLAARHELPVIEDDIYGDLHHHGERPKPVKAFDRGGWVMLCSSFSKTLAPGFRVGWISAGRFTERVQRLKFISTVSTPLVLQQSIAEFLESGGYDHHLRSLRRAYTTQLGFVMDAILHHFPKGTRVTRPQGGFILWVEFPEKVDSLRLQTDALKRGISIAPGPIFTARDRFRNYVRINCGNPWSKEIERALITVGQLAELQL